MPVAFSSNVGGSRSRSHQSRSRQSKAKATAPALRVVATPVSTPPAPVRVLPPTTRPLWLRALVVLQATVSVVTGGLMVSVLGVYGATVHAHRQLITTRSTLERLQEQEKQLTTANAVFQNYLARQAALASETGGLHPKDVIFLEAPVAAPPKATPIPLPVEPKPKNWSFPMGY
jgi:hypothetical protein